MSEGGSAEIFDMEDARTRMRDGAANDSGYVHAGAILEAARKKLGLLRADAAAKTHIKERHIEAIEELYPELLPERPYAIGFVKSYAAFLGLDASAIAEQFKEDAGFSASQPILPEEFDFASPDAPDEGRDLSLAAVIAITAFILWAAYQITLMQTVRTPLAAAPAERSQAAPAPAALSPDEIFQNRIDAGVIERVSAVYPPRCLSGAASIERVAVTFNINTGGDVVGERVLQSSNPCFETAALNALRRWRFETAAGTGAPRAFYDQRRVFIFELPG